MRRKRKGSLSRTIFGMFAIIVGIVICTTTSIFALDVYCNADINHWTPIYPDAELVDTQDDGFFRPRASGITRQVYYTPDEANDVRQWFNDYRIEITSGKDNSANANAAASGIATTRYQVSEDSETGGSFISYYSECAYN